MRPRKQDAILVLGGGLREGGVLPEYVKRRLDLAMVRESGEPIAPVGGGTSHRPAVLDSDGRLLPDALAVARYLIDRGVSPERIFCESTSYDTIGNAYFSRVQLAEPLGWKRLLIITSQFHLPRTEAIFRWIYSLDAHAPYQLSFAAAADEGLSEAALTVRLAREESSLQSVAPLSKRLTSLRMLAEWLFTQHKAYMSVREPMIESDVDLLESY